MPERDDMRPTLRIPWHMPKVTRRKKTVIDCIAFAVADSRDWPLAQYPPQFVGVLEGQAHGYSLGINEKPQHHQHVSQFDTLLSDSYA